MSDEVAPYADGGTLTPGTTCVTFPEEVRIWTRADLDRLRDALDRMSAAMENARYGVMQVTSAFEAD